VEVEVIDEVKVDVKVAVSANAVLVFVTVIV
jgi:hypothetical protein